MQKNHLNDYKKLMKNSSINQEFLPYACLTPIFKNWNLVEQAINYDFILISVVSLICNVPQVKEGRVGGCGLKQLQKHPFSPWQLPGPRPPPCWCRPPPGWCWSPRSGPSCPLPCCGWCGTGAAGRLTQTVDPRRGDLQQQIHK